MKLYLAFFLGNSESVLFL